ncbi:MAG: hypothetical protein ACHQE5_08495 [Actinomycetes bacterium]
MPELEFVVGEPDTAVALGSGDVPVLATPRLLAWLEAATVAAELRQETEYDGVVRALGGAGETVSRPQDVGPALDRAFASGVPYLVNVLTDPKVAYPRTTTGV